MNRTSSVDRSHREKRAAARGAQRIENNLTGDYAGIVDALPLSHEHIGIYGLFGGNIDNATFVGTPLTVGRLNVRNGGRSPLFEDRESDRVPNQRLLFDNSGALRIRAKLDGHNCCWEYRASDNASFKSRAAPLSRLRGNLASVVFRGRQPDALAHLPRRA